MKTKLLYTLLLSAPLLMAIDDAEITKSARDKSPAQRERARQVKLEKIQQEEAVLREQARQDREAKNQASRSAGIARPETRDVTTRKTERIASQTVTKVTIPQNRLEPKISDRIILSDFETAIKFKNPEKLLQIWEDSKKSPFTTEEFVKPLNALLHDPSRMAVIFPGKTFDEANEELTDVLKTISPHLAKVYRDSFSILKSTYAPRTDEAYLQYLNENPERLTIPLKPGEPTPLEIAITGQSPEMARAVIAIARAHNISLGDLLEPILNEYKKGIKSSTNIVKSINEVGSKALSRLFDKYTNNAISSRGLALAL